jgi:hypothetical protein
MTIAQIQLLGALATLRVFDSACAEAIETQLARVLEELCDEASDELPPSQRRCCDGAAALIKLWRRDHQ